MVARVALIGAGTIAASYVDGLRSTPDFEAVAVCARTAASTQRFAQDHGLAALSLEALLADPTIDYVLNLTPAQMHEAVTRSCLQSGKAVYSEKPLATTLAGADALIALAESRGLLLACAPATFLWPPLATAQRLLEEARLGRVMGALATLVYPGPELFHPHPAHLYAAGAGPLHDMGVYLVTALMALLGPIVAVSAMSRRALDERSVQIGPAAGTLFPVETPTHIHAQLEHRSGAISSLIVSFDASSATPPRLDLFGSRAGLGIANVHAPDAVLTLREGGASTTVRLDAPWSDAMLALGPTSAWTAWTARRPVTTSAARARNVLEVLLAVADASDGRRTIDLTPED